MFGLLALALAASPTTAEAIAATTDRICIPALARETPWPKDPADETALLATAGLMPGIPTALQDLVAESDPQLAALSGAILASHDDADGAFGMALGGAEQSCRLLVYRSKDSAALVSAIDTALAARGWKQVTPPANRTPQHLFLRRTATGRIAIVHLVLPVQGAPIAPVLVVDVLPAGAQLPAEYRL